MAPRDSTRPGPRPCGAATGILLLAATLFAGGGCMRSARDGHATLAPPAPCRRATTVTSDPPAPPAGRADASSTES